MPFEAGCRGGWRRYSGAFVRCRAAHGGRVGDSVGSGRRRAAWRVNGPVPTELCRGWDGVLSHFHCGRSGGVLRRRRWCQHCLGAVRVRSGCLGDPSLVSNMEISWEHEFFRRFFEYIARHVRVHGVRQARCRAVGQVPRCTRPLRNAPRHPRRDGRRGPCPPALSWGAPRAASSPSCSLRHTLTVSTRLVLSTRILGRRG